MDKELKKEILRIIIAGIQLGLAIITSNVIRLETWQMLILFLIPYLFIGYDVLKEAFEKIIHGEFFEEDFLMSLATIGALLIGFLPNTDNMFAEAVFVMLFFKVGELFEEIAEGKTEKSIEELMEIRPEYANLVKDNEVQKVTPEEVKVGEIIEVYPGEKVPLDGVIIKGTSAFNTSALTGESVRRTINQGEDVYSGFINLSSNVSIKVTKVYSESSASKIIDLVKNAVDNKSKSERFITKFSKVYTPLVILIALILAIVPPILSESFIDNFASWLTRSLTFLVVSCPCALVISVPLAFFGGIGALSKKGVLVKGSSYLENLRYVNTIIFDKTGTLTKGSFEVVAIHPEKCDENQLLHLAAHVERYSKHPIAISLKEAFKNEDDNCTVEVLEDIAGKGIKAVVNGDDVVVGNDKLMSEIGIVTKSCEYVGTIVHVAVNDEYYGHIVISDKLKDDAQDAMTLLKMKGFSTVMLTGDHEDVAKDISNKLGITEYFAELLPEDKYQVVKEIVEKEGKKEKTIFVGDGINDAPAIANADIGVAMGSLGQDAAIEVADVVLMNDKVMSIVNGIDISNKTVKIAKQNIIFAILVKIVVLILASFGYAPMWLAVFADVGVTVLAVLNAMRTLKL